MSGKTSDVMPAPVLAAIRAHAPLRIPCDPNSHGALLPAREWAIGYLLVGNPDAEPDVLVAYCDTQLTGPRARLQTWDEFLATVESQAGEGPDEEELPTIRPELLRFAELLDQDLNGADCATGVPELDDDEIVGRLEAQVAAFKEAIVNLRKPAPHHFDAWHRLRDSVLTIGNLALIAAYECGFFPKEPEEKESES